MTTPALPILILEIAGLGVVDVSGYGLFFGSGTTNTIEIGDGGETVNMTAITGPQPLYVFAGWSGDGTSSDPLSRTFVANYDTTYRIRAEFTGSEERLVGGPCCGADSNYPRAPPEPTSESVRIAARRECAAQQALPPAIQSCVPCRRTTAEPQRRYTTMGERDRMLYQLSRCAFYRQNPHTGGLCSEQRSTAHTSDRTILTEEGSHHLEVTLPHAVHQYRSIPRIRGIEDIAHVVRGPSAGELTARRRAAIERAAATATRHGEHYRTLPPPPPCTPPNILPQPGVPTRFGLTPCIPGTRRVDYSNPTAK
jgi:hypothetical protein